MSKQNIYEVTLRLTDIGHLFVKPDLSPLSEHYREYNSTSGIEFIAGELRANSSYEAVKASLLLPNENVEPGLQQTVKAGIERYCQARLRNVEQELSATRWRGIRILIVAFIALFVLVGGSKLINHDDYLILQILSEGLAIAGWVALWFPLELLTHMVWQQRLDKRIYMLLKNMDVVIASAN